MFAIKNTHKVLSRLILLSAVMCVLNLQAQQQPVASDKPDAAVEESAKNPDSIVENVPDSAVESTPDSPVESSPDSIVENVPDSAVESTPDSPVESSPDSIVESAPDSTVESAKESSNRRIERLGEASVDQWEMDLALPTPTNVQWPDAGDVVLPDARQNRTLQQILSGLAGNPEDTELLAQLNRLLADVLNQSKNLMEDGSLDEAEQLLPLIHSIDPGFRGLNATNRRLKILKEVDGLLVEANAALESQRVLEPENDNALYFFNQALAKESQSQPALQGLAMVQEALIERALESAGELNFETAEYWLLEAASVQEDQTLVEQGHIDVATFKGERAAELEQKTIDAMDAGEFDKADFSIIELIALGDQETSVVTLRAQLEEARFYGGFEPGQVIRDELLSSEGTAPEIVVIAPGSFLMGVQGGSGESSGRAEPQHRVTIKHGFGLGVREVSVGEYGLFIRNTGYQTAAEINGKSSVYDERAGRLTSRKGVNWQHDYKGNKADPDLPVMHVNLNDVQAYVQWLAVETGKHYRLPSEAEYEYVARAGGNGSYWWGEGSPTEAVENLTGDRDNSPGRRQWTTSFKKYGDGHWGPAPTGSIGTGNLVHPMGVYDIAGNVSEWTEDCWHQNYIKAPEDGSAWVNPGCERRVVRGGYWASSPDQCRAAFRISAKAKTYGPVVGFRIARDL